VTEPGSSDSPRADQLVRGFSCNLHRLTEAELRTVVRVVRALVDEDYSALESFRAYEFGKDPYFATHNWRDWDRVHLVMPPGDPLGWVGECQPDPSGNGSKQVSIEMWTVEEEGPSDLVLSVVLEADGEAWIKTMVT